jgi:dienelactone hydrolase
MSRPWIVSVVAALWLFTVAHTLHAEEPKPTALARELTQLSTNVLPADLAERFEDQSWRALRARGDEANRRDLANWRAIRSREDWERLREEQLKRLRASLGTFPEEPESLDVRITNKIEGDGFVIENLVYRTRPGLWVTANLYVPAAAQQDPQSPQRMPGILIAHSHHQPKTQEELQDMGMTWARNGCLVLVIDQLGHGERADHPFRSKADYAKKDFRPSRQDYQFRYDTNTQLYLVGESLMGWMAWDLMRGVDLLLSRPGIDPKKIILLGAVAGGGDPAGVTAALDPRIAAAVPFNFGGPQPETEYPLPEDAEQTFDYLSGAYWEGTRNLRRTGVDGFMHWVIVGSIAPRGLVYAHEFTWDREHDPVWKRLNTIYGFYDARDKLDYTTGRGSVRGEAPESTHCTNIGRFHRERIHAALKRWFDIDVTPEEEYSQRLDSQDLRSMTDAARAELKPQKLFEVLTELSGRKMEAARTDMASRSLDSRRKQMQDNWKELLGDIEPRKDVSIVSQSRETLADESITVERIALQTEPGITLPILLLVPKHEQAKASPVIVAVAQAGPEAFLREQSEILAELLAGGATVCLPELRETGTDHGTHGDGSNGSNSHYALYFETPMLGYRLRDLRTVLSYLRTREGMQTARFALWGDSFTPPNPPESDFRVPRQVSDRPAFSEPLGGLLALLGALYEVDVRAAYIHRGLSGYRDVLTSPYIYIPHDVVVPGVLKHGDVADLAAALAPRRLRMDRLVDGFNREVPVAEVRATYEPAIEAYQASDPESLSITEDQANVAVWLLRP